MAKSVLVIGASGNQGGNVFRAVLSSGNFDKVLFATRNVESEKAKLAASLSDSVELVKLDVSDVAQLKNVFETKKPTHVFAVTNYWEYLMSGKSPEESAEIETRLGKAIVDIAVASGVEHLVFSTLENTAKLTEGKLARVNHFNAKGAIEEYVLSLPEAKKITTFVRYAFYQENFGTFFKPTENNELMLNMADEPLFAVNLADAGKAIAAIFKAGDEYKNGTAIGLASDAQKVGDYMKAFSKLHGKEVKYVPVSDEDMEKAAGADLAEMFAFYVQFPDKCVRDIELTRRLAGSVTSFEDYIAAQL